jgi:D-alanyl-lipoteichoic acid acyltransferase DltB (MBOAT superfamily)
VERTSIFHTPACSESRTLRRGSPFAEEDELISNEVADTWHWLGGMLFPTVEYGLFFLLSLLLSWGALALHRSLAPAGLARWLGRASDRCSHQLHKNILLLLSYLFYASWDWHFVPLLFAISCAGWLATRGIQHARPSGALRALSLLLGVTACLGVLVFYKYWAFLLQTLAALAAAFDVRLQLQVPTPYLPLGISFMTFHAISMMMDAWRHKLKEPVPFADALLYVSFFPQLIAGPILRASTFLPQLRRPPNPRRIDTARALLLITGGLFKKVVIANTLATWLVDDIFANPAAANASQVLLGIYGYAAQIYCDFSGYTDIAIGCALLLGYRFPANFNAPYTAASPQEFWRRWHISLSTWLRDYLYIPLGGSRGGPGAIQRNLMITMLLGGLWHGAAWNFVFWGAWHGGLLVLHRRWEMCWTHRNARWRHSAWWRWLSRLLLFHAVCLGWVLFRCPDLAAASQLLARLVDGAWTPHLPLGPLLCVLAGIGTQYLPRRWLLRLQLSFSRTQPVWRGLAFALALLLCEVLGPSEPAPFIYFQF